MLDDSTQQNQALQPVSGPELMKKIIDMINGDGIFSAGESADSSGLCLDIAIEKPLDESEKQVIIDEFSVKWHENDAKIKNYFEEIISALPICYFDVTTSIELSYKLSDIAIVIFDKRDNTLKVINTMRQDISKKHKRKFAKSIIIKKSLDSILKEVYQMQAMKNPSKNQNPYLFQVQTEQTATRVAPSQDMHEVIIGTTDGKLLTLNVKDFRVKLFLENPLNIAVVDFIQKQNFISVGYENGQIIVFKRALGFQGYSQYNIKKPDGLSIKALKLSPYTKHFIVVQERKVEEKEDQQISQSSKIEEVKYELILYDYNKLINLGQTTLVSKKCQNFELKNLFDFSQNCVFVRSSDHRSFDVFSLQNLELLCQGPDNIDYFSIQLMISQPKNNQILLVGLLGDCYYYDSSGKVVDDEKVNMPFPYMITPFGPFDSKLVSLSDRLTLCKLSK